MPDAIAATTGRPASRRSSSAAISIVQSARPLPVYTRPIAGTATSKTVVTLSAPQIEHECLHRSLECEAGLALEVRLGQGGRMEMDAELGTGRLEQLDR